VDNLLATIGDMLADRLHGPLDFRFILQPLVATVLAIGAGLRDARAGRPAYGWRIVTGNGDRAQLLREGWREIARLYVAAVAIDLVYALVVYHWVYPLQAMFVAFMVAVPCYFLIRGLVNRIARRWIGPLAQPREIDHDQQP